MQMRKTSNEAVGLSDKMSNPPKGKLRLFSSRRTRMVEEEAELIAWWNSKRQTDAIFINAVRIASGPRLEKDLEDFLRREMKRRGYWEYPRYLLQMEEEHREKARGYEKLAARRFAEAYVSTKYNRDGSWRNHQRVRRILEAREQAGALNEKACSVLAAYRAQERKSKIEDGLFGVLVLLFVAAGVVYLIGSSLGFLEGRASCGRYEEWRDGC